MGCGIYACEEHISKEFPTKRSKVKYWECFVRIAAESKILLKPVD